MLSVKLCHFSDSFLAILAAPGSRLTVTLTSRMILRYLPTLPDIGMDPQIRMLPDKDAIIDLKMNLVERSSEIPDQSILCQEIYSDFSP